jgi:hypothetical protein
VHDIDEWRPLVLDAIGPREVRPIRKRSLDEAGRATLFVAGAGVGEEIAESDGSVVGRMLVPTVAGCLLRSRTNAAREAALSLIRTSRGRRSG